MFCYLVVYGAIVWIKLELGIVCNSGNNFKHPFFHYQIWFNDLRKYALDDFNNIFIYSIYFLIKYIL